MTRSPVHGGLFLATIGWNGRSGSNRSASTSDVEMDGCCLTDRTVERSGKVLLPICLSLSVLWEKSTWSAILLNILLG